MVKRSGFFVCAGMLMLLAGCSSPKATDADKEAAAQVESVSQAVKTSPKKESKGRLRQQRQPATPRPATPPAGFEPKMPGKRIARLSVPGKYVALTFDDGPHGVYTPQILDILRRRGAKATFYVVGQNAVRHKGILARAVAEGHEIGSHTWSHIKLTSSSHALICSEMERTSAVIREATGRSPKTMRPPYGATNQQILDLMMNTYGMRSILWDVDTEDWRRPGVGVVISRAVNQAKSGSIILLHDIHASTLAAVESVVAGLQARGFRLVTVSELINMASQAAGGASYSAAGQVDTASLYVQAPAPVEEQPRAADDAAPAADELSKAPAEEERQEPAAAESQPAMPAGSSEPEEDVESLSAV